MNKLTLILIGCLAITGAVYAVNVNRTTTGINVQGGTTSSTAKTLVISDSGTDEYSLTPVDITVSGVATSSTTTFGTAYTATPTIVQGVRHGTLKSAYSETILTSATTVSATTTQLIVTGLNSTTINNLRFMLYGPKRTGTYQ